MLWCATFVAIALLAPLVARANTVTVNSNADSGGICPGPTCTLRQAITTAVPGDTIDFSSSVSAIELTSDELAIGKSITITGPGADSLIVYRKTDSNGAIPAFRIFRITAGSTVGFTGLTIANGLPQGVGSVSGGAGILVENGCTATVASSKIRNNQSNWRGGGIWNNGTLVVSDTTFSENNSDIFNGQGAGIYNTGDLTVTGSLFVGNGPYGGALTNSGGTATLTNCTISGNTARRGPSSGGVFSSGGTLTLRYCTITLNDQVGVVGPATIKDCIIAQNNPSSFYVDAGGSITSEGYNIIGNNFGTNTAPGTGDKFGTNQAPLDPLLLPLQDNGGPTFTHALRPGSPALDAGGAVPGVTTDQRGFPRPADNLVIPNASGGDGSDIGAFERQEVALARSLNISTRSRVQTGDNVMIAGFIITGTAPKPVVLRGLGPSLVSAGIPSAEVLNDPVLELRGSNGALILSNDNWKDSPERAQIEGTPFQPADDREAVIRTTLPPATYTAVLQGKDNGTGIGIVEIYDLDSTSDSTLANMSSRAFVETGNKVLIGGFTLGGQNGGARMVIRAIGPSLANSGFANPLPDPTLELRDANGAVLASNDNWQENDPGQAFYIQAMGLQPQDYYESAIALTLGPGQYTAVVADKNGGSGVGLVEIYNLQ
jgi:Right handed beta helix region